MKAKKFFLGLLMLLALGLLCPGWVYPHYLTPRWSFTGDVSSHPGFNGSPAVGDDGAIYAPSRDWFWAINPDGTLKWGINLSSEYSEYRRTPAIGANGALIAHQGSVLYSLDPADGSANWEFYGIGKFLGSPAISKGGTIYIGSDASRLYAVNPSTGEKAWEYKAVSNQQHTEPQPPDVGKFANPVVGLDGTIYCQFGCLNLDEPEPYRLYAINPDTGTPKIPYAPLTTQWGECLLTDYSPAIGPDGTIYLIHQGWEPKDEGGLQQVYHLYAISPADLSLKWACTLPSPCTGAPVIGDGEAGDGYRIIVPCEAQIVGVRPNGLLNWTFESEGLFKASTPTVGHGQVFYFGTTGDDPAGYLFAAIPYQQVDMIGMDGPIYSSPAIVRVGNQNVLYIGSQDSLSAWNIGVGDIDPGLAHTSWPCDRGNLKRNGRASVAFSASYSVTQMMVQVDGLLLGNITASLGSKLESARQSLEKEDLIPARNKLKAFINEVRALTGKKILATDAESLIADAQVIVSMLQ